MTDCTMDLESMSKIYFGTLNVLAEKIAADIENTREAYQDLWHTLSKKEQNQAIDESIINPSAVLKYANLSIQPMKQNYNAYSWFSKSQLDLNLYDQLDAMGYLSSGARIVCRSDADQSCKSAPTEKEQPKSNLFDRSSSKNKNVVSSKNSDEKPVSKSQKGSVLKPKNPPPPPPKVIAASTEEDATSEEHETRSNDIPKTGFDFLDNW